MIAFLQVRSSRVVLKTVDFFRSFMYSSEDLGVVSALATQLDKHTVGYLTWRGGIHSSMSTTIVRDTATSHAAFAIQFGIPHSFFSLSYTHKLQEMEMKLRGSVKWVHQIESGFFWII
jgi:hypothetical protein